MRIEYLIALYVGFFAACAEKPIPDATDSGTLPGLVAGGDTSGFWRAKTRKVQMVSELSWFMEMAKDTGAMWRVLAVVDANAPNAVSWIQSLEKAVMVPGVEANVAVLIEAKDEKAATSLLLKSGSTLPGSYCPNENLDWRKVVDPESVAPEGPGLWIWQQGMTVASYYPWPEEESAWPGILYPPIEMK